MPEDRMPDNLTLTLILTHILTSIGPFMSRYTNTLYTLSLPLHSLHTFFFSLSTHTLSMSLHTQYFSTLFIFWHSICLSITFQVLQFSDSCLVRARLYFFWRKKVCFNFAVELCSIGAPHIPKNFAKRSKVKNMVFEPRPFLPWEN